MDTIYYNLNARKIKVSGGADLLTFVPTPVAEPAGEVLDFARCRRRLETKAAWRQLEAAAEAVDRAEEAPEEAEEAPAPESRRARAAGWMEMAASAAVIAVSAAAAAAFLGLV